ncbi:MAG: 50S ribosomal protein L18 [Candidatus Omnitrophota bacterium]
MFKQREKTRKVRHKRIRKRLRSNAESMRLCVRRSLKNLYIQVIDDSQSKTLFSFSTRTKEVYDRAPYGGNVAAAEVLGEIAAEKLKQKGIATIIFDRGGYLFHGRIKALADSLRKGGIRF